MNNYKKIGILGIGNRMSFIVKELLKLNPSLEIKSIYDPNKKSIEKIKKELKINSFIAENYKKITQDKEIDWIFIGSINSAHKEQIISALKNNKNIFSEKPLAISIKELKKIKKEFKNKKFIISYPLRHSSHYKKIKEIVDSGKIGKIISLEFNEILTFSHGSLILGDWRRFEKFSGGHLLEKCCHDLDILNWILRDIPIKVSSFGGNDFFIQKNKEIFDKIENKKEIFNLEKPKNPFLTKKDVVDNQVMILEYSKGTRATFHTNCSSGIPERRIYLCGEKGTLRADLITGEIEFSDILKKEFEKIFNPKIKGGHGGGDKILVKELNQAIVSGYSRKNDLDNAIISAATAIMADKARKKNKVINLKPVWKKLEYNF